MSNEKYYSFEDVQKETLKYFNGDELATKAFINKYALKDYTGKIYEKTPDDMHQRISKEFARIENKYLNPISEDEIYNLLKDFKYIVPQGSPMAGIGNNYQVTSLSNCFVIGNDADSYGGICMIDQEQVQLMKRRGGVGHDLSHIRPKSTKVNNSALSSTGVVPFMERFSNSTREVAQDGRRGALLLSLDVKHPDTEDFIDAKMETDKVTGANISIKLTDKFIEAALSNQKFTQQFPIDSTNPHTIKEIDAKKLWDKIIKNAWKRAEPGILFWDTVIRESVSDCYADKGFKTISTNPCGEITLSKYDSCRLIALNTFSYVNNPFSKSTSFDFELFKKHVIIAQRLMDDLIDLEIEKIDKIIEKIKNDPEPEHIKKVELDTWILIKQNAINGRRTGLGITALGDTLAALNLTYGTEQASNMAAEIQKCLILNAYVSSTILAKERGSFPIYDYDKEINSPFIKRLKEESPELDNLLKINGRRNIAISTAAPTGCVHENTIIKTSTGDLMIKDIFLLNNINIENLRGLKNIWIDPEIDLYVYDYNTNKKKITKLYWNGECDGFDMTFSDGFNVKTSSEHKFLIYLGDNKATWRRAEDLKKGDKIIKLK